MYAIHTTVVYECLCAEGNQNIPQLHIIHLNFVSTHAGNFVCRWTPKKPTESFPGQPANISIARTEKRQEKAIFFWGGKLWAEGLDRYDPVAGSSRNGRTASVKSKENPMLPCEDSKHPIKVNLVFMMRATSNLHISVKPHDFGDAGMPIPCPPAGGFNWGET